jgi:hypothetical protein
LLVKGVSVIDDPPGTPAVPVIVVLFT